MTTPTSKIVVITPVKNEAWILDRFLSVTSQFADHIIIADQNSTDESPTICKRYPKVTLIANKSEHYNEAERQILLLKTARELVPEHKIILALDADEIMAASATKTLGWQTMLRAKPGTVLCFEKPELHLPSHKCLRYGEAGALGYVDDGVEHKPIKIHSIRIPEPEYASRLYIYDVHILHYAVSRPGATASKTRLYSVIENALGLDRECTSRTRSPFTRREVYASDRHLMKNFKLEKYPTEWLEGWEKLGIDMQTIPSQKYHWQDFEVLHYFHRYGVRRFWMEDIWDFNWEACRLYAKALGMSDIPEYRIPAQLKILNLVLITLTKFYSYVKKLIKLLI